MNEVPKYLVGGQLFLFLVFHFVVRTGWQNARFCKYILVCTTKCIRSHEDKIYGVKIDVYCFGETNLLQYDN